MSSDLLIPSPIQSVIRHRQFRVLFTLSLLLTSLLSPIAAEGSEPSSLISGSGLEASSDLLKNAQRALAQHHNTSPQIRHELVRATPWKGGTRVRFEPHFDGLRVLGADRLVSLNRHGNATAVRSPALNPKTSSRQAPSLPAASAKINAKGFIGSFYGHTGELWPSQAELLYLAGPDGELNLVWRVKVSFSSPLAIYEVLVDATSGKLHGHRSQLFEARANVYPTNPSISDLEEVELLGLYEDSTELQGVYGRVVSCDTYDDSFNGGECTEKSHHAIADENGDFLFAPDPPSSDDPFAEGQMYFHLDRVARWFDEEQGFDHQFPTEAVVNFDYNNAFFGDIDGDGLGEIAFGQTGNMDYAYDADVIYHEFGHSVFGRIAGQTGFADADEYGMEWATGGLNEGTADLFSMVLTGDAKLGEYAATASFGRTAIRDLDEDRHCPSALYGESHKDGEIFGSFGWNLIENPEFGAALTGDFIYGAVAAFPSNASWAEAGEALVTTASDMLDAGLMTDKQYAIVTAELAASGLDNCGRVIRLDEGQEPTLLMTGVSLFEDSFIPIGNQFSLDAPEGTYRLRLRVKDFLSNEPNLGWALHVRRAEHVVHDIEALQTPFGNFDLPVPAEYDFKVEGTGDDFELILDADSDPALEPGATYYFAMASRLDGSLNNFIANAEITVDGDAYIDEVVSEDEEENDEDELSGGCSCEVVDQSDYVPALSLILLLGLLALRRRQ